MTERLRYPLVFLDVGETLIGPRTSFGAIYGEVLRDQGFSVETQQAQAALKSAIGQLTAGLPEGLDRYSQFPGGEHDFWKRCVAGVLERLLGRAPDPPEVERALLQLRSVFSEPETWVVFDDVIPTLEQLRRAGARLAIVSNWDSRLPRLLRGLDLERYFTALGVSRFEGVEKPNPEFFKRMLARLGAEPAKTLHVGDHPVFDVQGAERAGVYGVLIDRGEAHPQVAPRITSLGDLEALVRG